MVENRENGGIHQAIHRHAVTNNKYMKSYRKKSSYFMYLDASNLCGWVMPQKVPCN